MRKIDLRSDTVTLPSPEMREVMAKAEVGDDVYKEDPTVNMLETLAADILGKEAGMYVPSGTMSNLAAILAHCDRGDEYIIGQKGHSYLYEGGGAAVFGSVQPQPIDFEPDGTLDLAKVESVIKPDNFHYAKTRLLCLENTQGGKVLPLDYLKQAGKFARDHDLALHLDGARLFNAAVKLNVDPKEITRPFHSVSICLSKGLAAPVGSVLTGNSEFIKRARRWRKVLGGGMRQAGVIAAAGIIALTKMTDRLEEDHKTAEILAEGLSKIPGFKVHFDQVQTNMVFFELDAKLKPHIQDDFAKENIITGMGHYPVRTVTHYGIDEEDIQRVVEVAEEFSRRRM